MAESKRMTGDPYDEEIAKIDDPQEALLIFGLNTNVIRRFGDQLTLEDLLGQARKLALGHKYSAETPSEQDTGLAKKAVREVASHWLRSAGVGQEPWMFHSDPAIRRFGRRMYLELNPDGLSEDDLAKTKVEWKL